MFGIQQQWKYHLVLAIIYIVMDYYGDYVIGGAERFLKNFQLHNVLLTLSSFISLTVIYIINYRWLCPETLAKKRMLLFLEGIIILIFLFAGLRYIFDEVIVYHITGFHNYPDRTRVFGFYVFDNAYYSLKAILFSTSLYLLFLYSENKDKVFQLQLENRKAELRISRSQLGPHFLFNTLNSFYVELLEKQPETAKDIHKLSELLRFVTYESQQDYMPLSKDIKLIKDYIYFFQKRFENNLFVDFSIEGIVTDQQIPTMVLINFIENVFKHGVVNDISAPAKIKLSISVTHIELITKNKITPSERYDERGIGSKGVKKRLEILFENNYTLNYKTEKEYFNAYLKMPL